MKIWHHSMTDLSRLTHYRENIIRHAKQVLDEDIMITPHGVPPGVHGGVPPVDTLKYQYTEFLIERFVCEAAMNAEMSGYDAFTIGCYLDTGMHKARSLVDIPVLSVMNTSMLVSCTLGKKFGVVTISPFMQEHIWESAISAGLEKRVAAILSVDPPINEYQMEGDKDDGDFVERVFLQTCDKVLEAGADVIIAGEGVFNEFVYERGLRFYKSVPIIDGNAVMWQYAIMLAKLQKTNSLSTSRRMSYMTPPKEMLDTLQLIHAHYNLNEGDFS